MNSPTRIEVDAAIAALDERNERRFNALERKIDELIARFDERFLRMEERMTRFEERLTRFEEQLARTDSDVKDTRNIAASIRHTVITTAIGSVIAIVIGFGAITSSMQTNMLSAFTSGKEDAALQERTEALYEKNKALQEDMERQARETDAVLRAIRKDLETHPLTTRAPRTR